MDNETTRLFNDEPAQNEQWISDSQSQTPSESKKTKKSKKTNPIAAAAGGFVAGAAAGATTTMAASSNNSSEEIINPTEEPNNPTEDRDEAPENTSSEGINNTPSPEQVILANDEGIRYAHIEADNFSEAFSQARSQVGPGGVFEYNGRLYGTYYADEWNEMSAQEKVAFQSRVNEVTPSRHSASHAMSAHHDASTETIPANVELISEEPTDMDIRVLGVEAVQNPQGEIMNVALIECGGDQALLLDVDNNGTIDVMLYDDNEDGQLQESEVYDVSDAHIHVAELTQAQAAQEGGLLHTSTDQMPDYINDTDSIINI